MHGGPIIIGYDGSQAAECALREAGALLSGRPAIVVVVWEAGRAYELQDRPTGLLETPPASLDVRTALEFDKAMYESAQQLAQHGGALARQAGLDAEGLAVADDVTVADTLIRLAEERDSVAIVIGSHGHSELRELLLGSTSKAVVQRAPCPVLIARADHAN